MKAKKVLSAMAAAVMASAFAVPAVACGSDPWTPPANTDAYEIPQDYCRTYYEVFVRSFSDGDGDGVGDIRGLINNLDYLNDGDDSTMTDLGINGIWLMPIHPSPSYHGYDVIDYKDVNRDYGTLEDFDELIAECNKRDIWVQMDLVLNHTSTEHEWFQAAVAAAQRDKDPQTDEDLLKYSFVQANSAPSSAWHKVAGTSDYYYLGYFDSGMPDINLDNQEVRDYIKEVVDFWLERGVKSFRLDAVPWAYGTSAGDYGEKNIEFWTWFNDYCNAKGAQVAQAQGWANDGIARYCYNVGEVWTTSETTINAYYATGMSNFNYPVGANNDRGFIGTGRNVSAGSVLTSALANTQRNLAEQAPGAIISNFLTNHDNARVAGRMAYKAAQVKQAAGLMLLAPGSPYIYYGDEIGAAGSGEKDENFRLSFNWGDSSRGITENLKGNTFTGKQTFGSQKSQTSDPNSILTYYREAIRLRNRFPEIGRGTMTAYGIDASGKAVAQTDEWNGNLVSTNALNKTVAVYTLTWNGRTVLIAHNVGGDSAQFNVSDFDGTVVGTLKANGGKVTLSDGTLTLPAGSVAVLKKQ